MEFDNQSSPAQASQTLRKLPLDRFNWSGADLRALALECGADDVGVVEIQRPGLDPQRDEILNNYPWTRSVIGIVARMSREPLRGPPRSVANLEFYRTGDHLDEVCAKIVAGLESAGVRAVNPAMAFPMEMTQVTDSATWLVSHKPIAIEAGLGHMGVHRNVIHPKFGNFILLGTVLTELEIADVDRPIDYNPCVGCNLCVAVCPVGAIAPDGSFNFSACFTHNYREFFGGFSDWVEQIANSKDGYDYRRRVDETETASMWQSLTYGANYKSAYCLAVCPAGDDVIGRYTADRGLHIKEIVKPLQQRAETIYVVEGSDAEEEVRKRFKHKTVKYVGNGLRARSIAGLLRFMPYVFQPNRSTGLDATFHFKFRGSEEREATVTIRNRMIDVKDGLIGKANVTVSADSESWLGFLAREKSLPVCIATGKIFVSGDPRLLLAFGKCFPAPKTRHKQSDVARVSSLLKPQPSLFRRNDPATGKIRWRGELILAETIAETHNVKTFRFKPQQEDEIPFGFIAGQFLTLHVSPGGNPVKRSYTISSSPSRRDCVDITVKREEHGLVSRWLHDELHIGDAVVIEAPDGRFCFAGESEQDLLLIGGGVGLTPMVSIARYLTETRWARHIDLALGFRSVEDFILREEIERLDAANPNLDVHVAISRAGSGARNGPQRRIDAAFLAESISDISGKLAFLCGPSSMMESVTEALLSLGVPASNIRKEAFGTEKRDPATTKRPEGPAVGTAAFSLSGVSAPIHVGDTILAIAERSEIRTIDNACRSGSCGLCRVKLLSGDATISSDEGLTPEERAEGYVLACQAEPLGDIMVEA
jgi:ferredoxin-NADP reductase/epoxyqueuosine reductase QueG